MIVDGAPRRLLVAALALVIAAIVFRGSVASALVTRGDDLARAGNTDRAIVMYRRAAALDARFAAAADRLAFALVLRGAPGDAAAALTVADASLRNVPPNAALLADRAFAAERLHRWRDAERSFASAGALARDPRYLHLAATMARRRGDAAGARRHLRAALALDAAYAPARAALRRFNG